VPAAGSILGNAVQRLEDPTLLMGAGEYVDDLRVPNTAQVVFVRSSIAHGVLRSVDVADAERMPGVIAVYHACGNDLGLAPFQSFPAISELLNRPPLARERVRFVGDIVAAIVAESNAEAVDATETVVVDIDPLPAVISKTAAREADATLLFPDTGSNICFATALNEDEDPLESAEVVVEVTMESQRLAGVPMEPNGCLAVPGEPAGGLTLWVSHQAPRSLHTSPWSKWTPRPAR
jgi:aerobic carbon-monoxide dehydrogenase large subunit